MTLYGTLFSLPTTTEMLEDIGEVSTPVVSDFLQYAIIVIGIIIALWVVYWLFSLFRYR